nr:malate dehydrogenase [Tanacetum cinerariifolium]
MRNLSLWLYRIRPHKQSANNAYIFPGFGLGLIMCGATRVHDDLLLAASEGLAAQVQEEDFAK